MPVGKGVFEKRREGTRDPREKVKWQMADAVRDVVKI
jgi:hypothetical protein